MVYKGRDLPRPILKNFPMGDAHLSCCPEGWMNEDMAIEFIENFASELKAKDYDLPSTEVILFWNLHTSACLEKARDKAKELGIVLMTFHPNVPFVGQRSLDFPIFRSLKTLWRQEVRYLAFLRAFCNYIYDCRQMHIAMRTARLSSRDKTLGGHSWKLSTSSIHRPSNRALKSRDSFLSMFKPSSRF